MPRESPGNTSSQSSLAPRSNTTAFNFSSAIGVPLDFSVSVKGGLAPEEVKRKGIQGRNQMIAVVK